MTNVQKELIQTTIPRYCKFKGVSTDSLAIKVGVGHNIIVKMVKGDWEGIDNKFFRRVWLEIDPTALEGIYQTEDCKAVFDLCKSATTHKRMIGLTGDTGMGKSTALKAYAVRPNVFYFYVDSTVTVAIFLKVLLQEMGIYFQGNTAEMLNRVSFTHYFHSERLYSELYGKLLDLAANIELRGLRWVVYGVICPVLAQWLTMQYMASCWTWWRIFECGGLRWVVYREIFS